MFVQIVQPLSSIVNIFAYMPFFLLHLGGGQTKTRRKQERFFRQLKQKPQAILGVLTRIFLKFAETKRRRFSRGDFVDSPHFPQPFPALRNGWGPFIAAPAFSLLSLKYVYPYRVYHRWKAPAAGRPKPRLARFHTMHFAAGAPHTL